MGTDTINTVSDQVLAFEVEGPAVASVLVDVGLPHLDRPFDYSIPTELAEQVVPGCRVQVRFAGKRVEGLISNFPSRGTHDGRLAPIDKVVSAEPVLTPRIEHLARSVAERYAGTVSDILRFAIPPRQARVEAHPRLPHDVAATLRQFEPFVWPQHAHGAGYLAALRSGSAPRAVFDLIPGIELAELLAEAIAATRDSGRGVVVCVPDASIISELDRRFTEILGPDQHVVLSSAQKPAERYRSFLKLSRGEVRVVVGTRAAVWAPVADLGLVVIVDDGNDLHLEQRAPYPHAREVLLTRSIEESAGVLLVGHARSVEATSLVNQGWCQAISPDLITRRRAWPQLEVTDGSERGETPVRLPRIVFQAIREAQGAVLVQVPRQGYRSSLACQSCRTRARCTSCEGPLMQISAGSPPVCRWCATEHRDWMCGSCGGRQLRSPVVGQVRTAEEFARAFPDRTVLASGGSEVLETVEDQRALVLATPGAEPRIDGGYACVILLDTWLMLARDDIRVVLESHRRWFEALALGKFGARAIAVGDSAQLQALVRADPASVAERELQDRAETHLPPIGRLAVIDGYTDVIDALIDRDWTTSAEVLGPVPLPDGKSRLLLRAPRAEGMGLAAALKALAAERSAAKETPVRIQIDPMSF